MITIEFCGLAMIELEEPVDLDDGALDALAADIEALDRRDGVHYLDPRRPAGLDARRAVTQWPVICEVDLVELDVNDRDVWMVTERPELVTCADCLERLARSIGG